MAYSKIICLVSRQAMPNVIPVFMFKPSTVFLLMTDEEKKVGFHLKSLFESKNINVITKEGLDAYNENSVYNTLKDIYNSTESDKLVINITGGTKLMSLGAYKFASEFNIPAIYCDTEHSKIINLLPQRTTKEIKSELTIKDYLAAYGYKIEAVKNESDIKIYFPLFEFIESKNSIKSFIGFMNNVRERLAQNNPKFSYKSNDNNFFFSKNFDKYRLEFDSKNRNVITIASSNFKAGDWLEYYSYFKLCQKENLEVLSGVKLISENNIKNEIDLIALKDYKLHLYSCKSGRNDQNDLFQLETLRTITSGTYGKGYFITASETTALFNKRAEELNIKLINVLKTRDLYI